jgi:tRNA pseudouridine32 synthase/23S rRNA pseudouridine746 synthase
MQTLVQTITFPSGDPRKASEFLAETTGLSKRRIKEAMSKGAVWHQRVGTKKHRLRRATALLKPGDTLSIYYNEKLLAVEPDTADLISDCKNYSVWFKPPGLLTQGTKYGDHCSLVRQAQKYFRPARKVFAVHRLDREASGLVLVAHNKKAAAGLSRLFQHQKAVKVYRIRVLGNLSECEAPGRIERELDGKSALTSFRVDEYDPLSNTTLVEVILHTGRKHQIRRHFDLIGYPVMGDPRYGKGNKNTDGMKLVACRLEFKCPYRGKKVSFSLPKKHLDLKMNVLR